MRLLGDKGLLRGLLTTNLVGVVRPIPPPRDDSEKRHVYLVPKKQKKKTYDHLLLCVMGVSSIFIVGVAVAALAGILSLVTNTHRLNRLYLRMFSSSSCANLSRSAWSAS